MIISRIARHCKGLCALLALLLAVPALPAVPATEYVAKAAFIYNIALFSKFPNTNPIVRLCVLGRSPFGNTLNALEGKPLGESAIALAYPRSGSEAVAQCQILFISASEAHHLDLLAESARELGVMTISDIRGATRLGVMLELAVENQRIVFDFNGPAARAAGIVVSSKVLRLARTVY